MPKDEKDPNKQNEAKASGALSIFLGKNDAVYYYEGELAPDGSNFKVSNFKDIRDVIINKRKAVMASHVHDAQCEEIRARNNGDPNSCRDRDFVVVIKPDKDATYKNTVDMLDEMTINGVKRYALVDIAPAEEQLIAKTEGGGAATAAPAAK